MPGIPTPFRSASRPLDYLEDVGRSRIEHWSSTAIIWTTTKSAFSPRTLKKCRSFIARERMRIFSTILIRWRK